MLSSGDAAARDGIRPFTSAAMTHSRPRTPLVATVLAFVAVLLAAWPATAATGVALPTLERPTDVTSGWVYRLGDDLAWADPDFDDSGWERGGLDKAWSSVNQARFSGYSWFRLRVRLPQGKGRPDGPLGIALGRLPYGCYEVYAGGKLVARYGSLPPETVPPIEHPEAFVILAELVDGDGSLVVALRVWRDPAFARPARVLGGRPVGPFAVGTFDDVRELVANANLKAYRSDLPVAICAALLILVGLYHLHLYSRRRALREYLWFGVIALVAPVNILFCSELGASLLPSATSAALVMCSFHVNAAAWVEFLALLFGWRVPWWARAYQAVQVAFAVLAITVPQFALGTIGIVTSVSFLPMPLVWIVVVPWLAWRGNREARTICFGVVLFGLARAYAAASAVFLLPSLPLGHWALGILILSIAASLANRFTRVYSELDSLNHELETKVEQRTAELEDTVARLQVSERESREAHDAALDASRAKSVFLANMSHELRTPLNAVIGFAQVLERGSDVRGEARESLRIIQRAGEHLLGLINDVLSISKIEAGKLTLVEQPFDLPALLRAVQAIVRVRAEDRGLDVVFDLDPYLPKVVVGDEGKLRQVLLNLLGNAVKFTERGGVTLRASWRDGVAAFEVEDTGVGIRDEEIGTLFEAFHQTESGRGSKEGTGLGLVISREIVRLMGGDISVVSVPGLGTTFRFDVRVAVSQAAVAAPDGRRVAELEPGHGPVRVLIVDDKDENRLLLVNLLTAVGFEVQEAADGRQAIDVWDRWRPDAIFMDIRMPVLDGREATREIRRREVTAGHCKIIALTASAFEHERDDILTSGTDDFVTKPFRVETIFAKLAEHLGVRYRYDDEGARRATDGAAALLTPERMAALPPERLRHLYEALNNGDVQAAAIAAERIDDDDAPVGRALLARIKQYRIEELIELLETVGARAATNRHG